MKKNKKAAKPKARKVVEAKPYKIEKGIKLTEPVARQGDGKPGRVTVTARAMQVGDSFLIKDDLEALLATKQLRDLSRRERMNDGKREFVSRRVKNGIRIWRTK